MKWPYWTGVLCQTPWITRAGFGALETARGRLPLTALAVEARIVGLIAETRMRQTFRNSLDEPLEATYIFPLPDRAAVTSFRLHVAGRTVDGELKERGQAREEYDAAIAAAIVRPSPRKIAAACSSCASATSRRAKKPSSS